MPKSLPLTSSPDLGGLWGKRRGLSSLAWVCFLPFPEKQVTFLSLGLGDIRAPLA